MAINYNPTTWVDNTTPVNAQYLNNIEQGIANATTQINTNTNNIATNTSTINQHSADIAEIQQEISGGVGGGDAKESTSQEILNILSNQTSFFSNPTPTKGVYRGQININNTIVGSNTITNDKTYTVLNSGSSEYKIGGILLSFDAAEFPNVSMVVTDKKTNNQYTLSSTCNKEPFPQDGYHYGYLYLGIAYNISMMSVDYIEDFITVTTPCGAFKGRSGLCYAGTTNNSQNISVIHPAASNLSRNEYGAGITWNSVASSSSSTNRDAKYLCGALITSSPILFPQGVTITVSVSPSTKISSFDPDTRFGLSLVTYIY